MTTRISQLEAENSALRGENAELRKLIPAPPLSSIKGPVRTFRVSLAGVTPLQATFFVEPRWNCREGHFDLGVGEFSAIDLLTQEAGGDASRLHQAAWERYVKTLNTSMPPNENGKRLPIHAERDRGSFDIRSVGQPVPHLDIPARSPAEAFELFKRLHGIGSSTSKPIVEELPS